MEVSQLKNKDLKKIDVSPDMKFYSLLESFSYTVKGALSEYIDNALEAFRKAKADKSIASKLPEKLTVTININDDSITIKDDGPGILSKEVDRAMKPGSKPHEQSLSEFGIGMKAASMWFGKKWVLKSYPLAEADGFDIDFDLDDLIAEGRTTVNLQPVKKESARGVLITLSKLHRTIDEEQANWTWDELQETYQLFFSRKEPKPILNLIFKFKNSTIEPKDFNDLAVTTPLCFPLCKTYKSKLYGIGENRIWKKHISFMFEGKEVYGFISVGKTSSQSNPGIRLFRYGRLLRGTEKQWYRPQYLVGTPNKHAPSRFYAELHMDGLPVSNNKGDFIYDENLFLRTLKNHPDVQEYIEQAETYRANAVGKTDKFERLKTIDEYNQLTGRKTRNQSNDPTKGSGKKKQTKPKKKSVPPPIVEAPNNIGYSSDIERELGSLGYSKLNAFYASLGRISLKDEPILAYVAAWSFLESLAKALGMRNGVEFPAFFNSFVINKYYDTKEKKLEAKPIKQALTDISQKGNLNKHYADYYSVNAQQLVVDFDNLEVLIELAVNEYKNTAL